MENTAKRSKLLYLVLSVLILALIMTNAGLMQVYGATAKPAKPVIKSLKSTDADSFRVKSNKNSKVTGYQIRYSLKMNFSNSKRLTVKGKRLNKTVTGLQGGKKYYVRIRAYKTSKGKKIYSSWSKWKSVPVVKSEGISDDPEDGSSEDGTADGSSDSKPAVTSDRYMTSVTTNVYKNPKTSSGTITLWYNTKVKLVSSQTSSNAGTWYKIKYRGKYYYMWDKTNNPVKITKTNAVKSDEEYLDGCTTDLQRSVLAKAFDINNNWVTAYDFDSKYSKVVQKNGSKYLLHCSGFVSYVFNKTIQKEAPPFELSSKPDVLANTGYVLNEGLTGQIKGRTICSGKLTAAQIKKLQPGDIVCFKLMSNDKRKIDHVGIYIGNGQFIQSTRVLKGLYNDSGYDEDGGVCIAPLSGMYKDGFKKAVRILPSSVISADKEMTVTAGASHTFSDKNCEKKFEDNALHAGDAVKLLYTYRTSSGKHNAYIAYGDNYSTKAYLYDYEGKLK